jgi:LmbE family N-acetylglucosaminyl deacetylase
MRVLVVAAHPDDEVLGAGGVMAMHAAKGDYVSVLFLGTGITSRHESQNTVGERQLARLRREAQKSHRVLGVRETFFRSFADNRFDSVNLLDLVKAVEEVKAEVRPSLIYTNHPGDLNVDHRQTAAAVLTATRPVPTETVRKILAFEVLSSTEWNFGRRGNVFCPSVYADISRYLLTKKKAMQAYASEVRPFPHPRSIEGLEILAKFRGMQVGKHAAEAFELIRDVL